MRILIGCDAKSSFEKLYYDLKRAGFPQAAEVYVLSVADVFMVPGYKKRNSRRPANQAYFAQVDQEIKKAQRIADNLTRKLIFKFPGWRFHPEGAGGSPAMEILRKAKEWQADLIVVGSHGKAGVGEFFLGSVALKVLSAASCSVRIVRTHTGEIDSPSRLVVGVDGSKQSDFTIDVLSTRQWKQGSAVHLVTVTDTYMYTAFLSRYGTRSQTGTIPGSFSTARIKKLHEGYKGKLQKAGLIVSSLIKRGDARDILLQEAKRWGAECIFVGAMGHNKAERFFIGSVSSSVAAHAHCSVEINRKSLGKE